MSDIPPPFESAWFLLFIGALCGIALGSFISMLSYRLPLNMSIIKPGSYCPKCKTGLKPTDLVPILSWILSGGMCRYCKAQIPARYPIIELVTGIATALAFAWIGISLALLVIVAVIVAIITWVTIWYETT
ncbi:MAG: prepilin peptidase [Alphaproteobacteria bacterium]